MTRDDFNEDRARRAGELSGPTLRDMIERRVELLGREAPEDARSPALKRLFGEIAELAEPVRRAFQPPIDVAPATHKRVVILLPGFGTHPVRMRYMAQPARSAPDTRSSAGGWASISGLDPREFEALARARARRPRALRPAGGAGRLEPRRGFRPRTRQAPSGCVAKVVTMGSPFSGIALRQQRLAHLPAGHRPFGRPAAGRGRAFGQAAGRDGRDLEPARRDRQPARVVRQPGERDRAMRYALLRISVFPIPPDCIRAVAQGTRRRLSFRLVYSALGGMARTVPCCSCNKGIDEQTGRAQISMRCGEPDGSRPRCLCRLLRVARRPGKRLDAPQGFRGRELLPPHRHHLQRLWRERCRRTADPVRHGPADHHRAANGAA